MKVVASSAIGSALKDAAVALQAEFPGAHVICLAVQDGVISLNAQSPAINDKLEVIAALQWVADQTAKTVATEVAKRLGPPKGDKSP